MKIKLQRIILGNVTQEREFNSVRELCVWVESSGDGVRARSKREALAIARCDLWFECPAK